MRKNIRNYSLLAFALASITIGSSAIVYAETTASSADTSQTDSKTAETKDGRRDHKGGFGLDQSSLESFVANGTLDQATADKVIAYLKTQEAIREEEKAKTDAMTKEERKEYFSANKGKKKGNIFSNLVSEGIITQTQADAMKAAMPERKKEDGEGKRGFGFGNLEKNLASLVSAGTIDQDAADKITAYLNNLKSEREAERAKVEAMTETEKQEYFSSNNKKERIDLFTEMVNKGIITQTEADAIKAAMPEKTRGNHPASTDLES
ncbi:MAG: hypothetical protein F8N38_14460 [Hungatella sp.]|nr:hypothetical protein [Hungatella sp.]